MKSLRWSRPSLSWSWYSSLRLRRNDADGRSRRRKNGHPHCQSLQTRPHLGRRGAEVQRVGRQGSGGRLDVQIDAGTKSEEVINKTNRTGEIEMQSNGTMFLQDYAPPYYFFTGPYVMKDFEHYMRAWNGKLGQAARAQLEKNDLKYLATIYRGLRQMTTKKPVYTPADVYGLKLRLPNVPTWLTVWKAMDASPIAVPLPELY